MTDKDYEEIEHEEIENGVCAHCGKPLLQYINIHSGEIEPLFCYDGICMMTDQQRRDYEDRMDRYLP